ncbi:MAG: PAS domain S-box protein, partial [Spirulinaceae cyanobacterium RM2_2_10]|nr:PAS domain S-box protein [Spirulinaceae cyanobacterium RM2_2_10]
EELELRVEERTTQLMNLNEELLHEIEERNRFEASLQTVEKRFASLFSQTDIGIIQTSRTGQFLKVNPRFLQLVGYDEASLSNKTFQELTHPDDLANAIAQFRRLLAGESAQLSLEQRYLQPDGTPVWVEMSGTVVRDSEGEVEYFLAAVADASDRVQAKSALAAVEATLSSFYTSSSMMMGVVELLDGDLRHVSDNPMTTAFFGVSPLAMHNRLASEMGVPTDIREHWIERCRESAALGKPVRFEYAYAIDLDGTDTELRWLAATVAPIPASGRFSYIVEDITAQRAQAAALHRAQEQLDTSTNELDARQQEMSRLTALADFLRASRTLSEAYDAIAELIAPLFPNCSGAVFALNAAGSRAEAIATWGDDLNTELSFPPEDSWALRLSKPHWADREHPRLLSAHVHRDRPPAESLQHSPPRPGPNPRPALSRRHASRSAVTSAPTVRADGR